MNQLTNQELITELKKRIQTGTLKVQTTPHEFEQETKSLLSYLNSKSLLLLVGLGVGFTFLVCSMITATTSLPTGGSLEFQDLSNNQIEVEIQSQT